MSRQRGGPQLLGINLQHVLLRLLINTIAVLVAAKLISGIHLQNWQGAVLAGGSFGIVNTLIKPVIKTLTCPLYMLTMGVFALVVNAGMLMLTSWIDQQLQIGFSVNGFAAALTGALVIGVVAWLVALALPD